MLADAGIVNILVVRRLQSVLVPVFDVAGTAWQIKLRQRLEAVVRIEIDRTPRPGRLVQVAPTIVHRRGLEEVASVWHAAVAGVGIIRWYRATENLCVVDRRIRHARRKFPTKLLLANLVLVIEALRFETRPHRRNRRDYVVEEDQSGLIGKLARIVSCAPYAETNGLSIVNRDDNAVEIVRRAATRHLQRDNFGGICLMEVKILVSYIVADEHAAIRHAMPARIVEIPIPVGRDDARFFVCRHAVDVGRRQSCYSIGRNLHNDFVILRNASPSIHSVKVDCANTICVARRIHCRVNNIAHHYLTSGGLIRSRQHA